MRIQTITPHVLKYELPEPFGSSLGLYKLRQVTLVEVTTDDGITGWGESYGLPEPVAAAITAGLAPMVLGKDPFDTEPLWHHCYSQTRNWGQKGPALAALSALDIAFWDIKAQALNLPLYRLLGGAFREQVSTYASGCYYKANQSLADLEREAASYRERRFPGLKMKIGGRTIVEDVQRVAAVRAAIGDDMLLMVDANRAYDPATAIEIGRRLEEQRIFWLEEPVPPEDVAGYCQVKGALKTMIAGGETEHTRWGFARLLEARAVDVAQPEACSAGGISEYLKIATLASIAGATVVPHFHGTAVAFAAALHLAAALPGPGPASLVPLLELDQADNPLRELLAEQPLETRDGLTSVPDRPGLGITLDRKVLERYSVA